MHVDDLVRRAVHLRVLLGRADQRGDPGGRVLDLVHQQLGLDRVVQPAHAPPSRSRRARRRRPASSQSTSSPACDEASARAPSRRVTPWSSSQSPSSSSASAGLHRAERRRLGHPLDRLLLQLDQRRAARPVELARRRSWPSLCRIPATRSRSAAVARTAAAAGLFSSWVSPADSDPSASSRSRWPIDRRWLLRMPKNSPSSRCIAIGNHSRIDVAELGGAAARRSGDVGDRLHRLRRRSAGPGRRGRPAGAGVDAALVGPVDLDLVAADQPGQHDRAVEQHVEAGRGVALAVHRLAGSRTARPGRARHSQSELLVVELLEQEQRAQLVGVAAGQRPAHRPPRSVSPPGSGAPA